MRRYRNLSGNSGVEAYDTGRDYIEIRFRNGATYIYNHQRPGKAHVDAMISLAERGAGLSGYISKYVRENYASKR